MKKWIIRIIVAILVIGAFAGVGFTAYQMGYSHGAQASVNIENKPPFAEHFDQGKMPEFQSRFPDRGFDSGFPHQEFQMRHHGGGFGFFSPFMFLARIALFGLVIWLIYMMFKGNGWQLSLTRNQPTENLVETDTPKKKTAKKNG